MGNNDFLKRIKMFAVIFKAQIAQLDNEYFKTASRMRELAIGQYGCKDFVSVVEGDNEISISYWDNMEQIKLWKCDPEHMIAQEMGKTKWYASYSVEIANIVCSNNEK